MTNAVEIQDRAASALQRCGFSERGRVWHLPAPDIQWVAQIARHPGTQRVTVDVGLELQNEALPAQATDCGILLRLEEMSCMQHMWVTQALDTECDLEGLLRDSEIDEAIYVLGEYVDARGTLAAIRQCFLAGEFVSARITDDAHSMLVDDELSPAIVAWTGWGSSATPTRDEASLISRYGSDRARELALAASVLAADFQKHGVHLAAPNLQALGDQAAVVFRDRHPHVSDEAVAALRWCFLWDRR